MPEWRSVTLGDLVELQRGYDLPTPRRRLGVIPVVGAGGTSGWHDTHMVPGPGVVVGRAGGSMGMATYVHSDFWPLNTALFVKDFRGNDPGFVYYLLSQIEFSGYNSGAAHPMLNRNYVKHIPIRVPPRRAQRAIAAVLGSLEDKIAVNERIAGCARRLGRELYRSALNEGGAQQGEVGSLAETVSRGITPRYSEASDDLMVVNQRCIRDGFISLGQARRTTGDRMRSEKLLKQYDVLVNSTGMGTLGRVGIWSSDELCTADSHVTIVRFRDDTVDPLCAGFAMLDAQPRLEAMGEGSTGQTELSRAKLSAMKIVVPSREAMSRLRPTLESLESYGQSALSESRSLAGLRDALLPKLMSGEIRVRDAEQAVERAT